ncbi:FSH1-domain-containing protein, partial [Patellaria atrata CBS 101060]
LPPRIQVTVTARHKMTTQNPRNPLRILMLHGFTQSGPLFHAKTRALEKNLQKAFPAGCTLVYPTAPIRLLPSDLTFDSAHVDPSHSNSQNAELGSSAQALEEPDAWGWWRRKGDTEPYTYEGLEIGLEKIAQVLKEEGPFDGVIGFSQGGAAAGMVASLLEPGRREAFEKLQLESGMRYPESFEKDTGYMTDMVHPPFKFAVSYSGFGAASTGKGELYRAFYEPKIKTPMLHILGSVDTVVEEKRSLRLVEACEKSEGRVVYHPGGHFLPSSQKQYVGALVGFIREIVAQVENKKKKDENVENMDVPF